MKEPKIKPKAPPPKTINRSIRTPKGVKTGVNKATDGMSVVRTCLEKMYSKILLLML